MKKNFLTSIITIALVFCLLAACDEDEKNKDEEPPTVTSVTVSPATANVNRNQTRHFDATVTGTGSPAKTVTWAVTGNTASGTTISPTGFLTVASDETANATLTVTATSTVDATKSGTATVSVKNIVVPSPSTDNRIKDPATQNSQLSTTSITVSSNHGGGNKPLTALSTTQNPTSAHGYETWDEDTQGTASFSWYGANQGGGAAFKAAWGDTNQENTVSGAGDKRPKDFLARVGYFWNTGSPHTAYGNIYCGYNFTMSGQYRGNFSYIGIYGWSKNPTVEYYIVENSYGNAWSPHAGYISSITGTIFSDGSITIKEEKGQYSIDGVVYKVYMTQRTGPSIEGNNTTFKQYFSIRQTARTSGTVPVTEHFKQWEEKGMYLGSNMYECKFKVEVGGRPAQAGGSNAGSFDARFIQFYRADDNGTILQITP